MINLNLHGFKKTKNLRNELENVALEIQEKFPESNLTINLEMESRRKKIFSLAMIIRDKSEETVITRYGSQIMPMVHHVKKDLIAKLHQHKERELSRRSDIVRVA